MAKIMVFEDEPLLAGLYERMLTNLGHTPYMVDNGEEGLKVVKSIMPDVILMDIMMPKLNGIQALEAIKNDKDVSQIPIIVMTNMTNVNDETEVMSKGAAMYIDKSQSDPKRVADLVQQVIASAASQTVTKPAKA